MRWIVLTVVAVASLACDPTVHKLASSDCKARTLTRVDACHGEDRSFQECLYYFRAEGRPDPSFCSRLPKLSRPEQEVPRCDWSKPEGWKRVACGPYKINGVAACFMCASIEPEASRIYVYGYDAACTRGVEQVSCNVTAEQAAFNLGAVSF